MLITFLISKVQYLLASLCIYIFKMQYYIVTQEIGNNQNSKGTKECTASLCPEPPKTPIQHSCCFSLVNPPEWLVQRHRHRYIFSL